MNLVSDIDLAYIAGIVDGEGCIAVNSRPDRDYRHGRAFFSVIRVVNTNEPLVRWLKDCTGVGSISVTEHRSGSVGLSHQPSGKRKTCYSWRVHTRPAEDLAERLLPYLKVKRLQAQLLLKFSELKRINFGQFGRDGVPDELWKAQERIHLILKRLNARGEHLEVDKEELGEVLSTNWTGRYVRPEVALIGETFGSWTAVGPRERRGHQDYCLCRCSCGVERSVSVYTLTEGLSFSCGRHPKKISTKMQDELLEELRLAPLSTREIAQKYGLSYRRVLDLRRVQLGIHGTPPTERKRCLIAEIQEGALSTAQLADKYGYSRSHVWKVRRETGL